MTTKKVIIVDDHKLFRKGLVFLLQEMDEVEVIGEASNGIEFLQQMRKQPADIALMDINMPIMDGIEASEKALQEFADLKIIVLSMHDEEAYYQKMTEMGVSGFLLKNSESEDLETAIREVIKGNTFFSQELLLSIIRKRTTSEHPQEELVEFSNREMEVLQLICQGYSNAEIADQLFISQRTVDRHRANMLSKSGCKNSISLVLYSVKHQLVNL